MNVIMNITGQCQTVDEQKRQKTKKHQPFYDTCGLLVIILLVDANLPLFVEFPGKLLIPLIKSIRSSHQLRLLDRQRCSVTAVKHSSPSRRTCPLTSLLFLSQMMTGLLTFGNIIWETGLKNLVIRVIQPVFGGAGQVVSCSTISRGDRPLATRFCIAIFHCRQFNRFC